MVGRVYNFSCSSLPESCQHHWLHPLWPGLWSPSLTPSPVQLQLPFVKVIPWERECEGRREGGREREVKEGGGRRGRRKEEGGGGGGRGGRRVIVNV